MGRLRHTLLATGLVLVACFALFAMQCPELACTGCSDDDVAARQSVQPVHGPDLLPAPVRVEATVVASESPPMIWSPYEAVAHPALVARLVI